MSEVCWLSDSRTLLFVSAGRLYRVTLDGGAAEPLPVGGDVSDVTISPDGGHVAFLREGDLWMWPLSGSAPPQRLTAVGVPGIARVPLGTYNRADVEVGTGVWGADWMPYAWSPDGGTIAFHMVDRRHIRRVPFPLYLGPETVVNELRRWYPGDENERRSLGLVSLESRSVRMITLEQPGQRGISDFAWSRGGRLLIDQVSDTGVERWLWVLDRGDTPPRLVWHDRRDTRVYPAYVARWHSDSRHIVLVADVDERDRLYTVDADAATPMPAPLTSGDWDVAGERGAASVHVGPDGALFFTGTMKSPYERHVYRVTPDGKLAPITTEPGTRQRRITTSPPPEFSGFKWVRPRYETFKNRVDASPVHARILEPSPLDRRRRHPVVFGPVYSNTVRNRWGGLSGTLQQFLVQKGYIVVQADVRGSVGCGRAFREAFLMDYGGKSRARRPSIRTPSARMTSRSRGRRRHTLKRSCAARRSHSARTCGICC